LRLTSDSLADVASSLSLKVKKMEAISDFTEQHEEKYIRLFQPIYQISAEEYNNNSSSNMSSP
jgi:hypothetical protein